MKTPFYLMTALSLAVATPALAQEAEAEQTLVIPVQAEARPTQSKGITSAGGPGGRNITAFDRGLQTTVGGYYDFEFKQPFGGISFFDQHRLILTLSSQPHENLFFNTEIEFEHGGLINALTNDGELKIEQAWGAYSFNELLALRAGVVLVPFGIVNVLHDSDVRETTTRPLMASTIIPTTWMEPGVGLYGTAYPNEDWQITYEGYVTQGLNDQISAARGLRNARPSLAKDNNGNKAVTGRVGLSPFLGLDVGLNGYYGAYDVTGELHMGMVGADVTYTNGPFEVLGEVAGVNTEGGTVDIGGKATAVPTNMAGYYVEGRYRFFPEFLHNTFLGRANGFDNATLTAFARYGGADTNQAVYDASDKTEAVIGLNYRPIPSFVTKIEFQRLAEPATGKTDDAIWSSMAIGF